MVIGHPRSATFTYIADVWNGELVHACTLFAQEREGVGNQGSAVGVQGSAEVSGFRKIDAWRKQP